MDDFLQERLQGKLDKLPLDDPKREALLAQFRFDVWVEDAARRVPQIQVVTHSLKAIHPDAKGTNLYAPPDSLEPNDLVGSHVLINHLTADVVGNAAALDVYKFLKLECEGRSLLDRVSAEDADLAAALSDDPHQAQAWMQAFASIAEPRGRAASHTKGKQVYWLVGDDPTCDDDYHLLAPLYGTSLAHHVFQTINEDRFGEAAKAARKARREERPSAHGYRDYPNLAIQKLGGTKPQNISQLNSERGGKNYLLASLPPVWRSPDINSPLNTHTVFPRFGRRPAVRQLLNGLRSFLESDPDKTVHTRDRRDDFTAAIIDELLQFAAELHSLEPGWSASADCRLVEVEKLWLDPCRAEFDEPFRAQWQAMEWPREVRNRFANWLNGALDNRLPVGDVEHRHWAGAVEADRTWSRGIDTQSRWIDRLIKDLDTLQGELA